MQRFNALGVIGMAIALLSGCSYGQLTEREEAVKAEWSEAQNELRKRDELVPKIVDLVKSHAPEEQPVLQAVAESRARLAGARTPEETMRAANQQWTALAGLMAVVENYPQLKANESFNRLMEELKSIEIRIAVERMRYNAQVQQYNMSRRGFSGALTAGLLRFPSYPLFGAPASTVVPEVEK